MGRKGPEGVLLDEYVPAPVDRCCRDAVVPLRRRGDRHGANRRIREDFVGRGEDAGARRDLAGQGLALG